MGNRREERVDRKEEIGKVHRLRRLHGLEDEKGRGRR